MHRDARSVREVRVHREPKPASRTRRGCAVASRLRFQLPRRGFWASPSVTHRDVTPASSAGKASSSTGFRTGLIGPSSARPASSARPRPATSRVGNKAPLPPLSWKRLVGRVGSGPFLNHHRARSLGGPVTSTSQGCGGTHFPGAPAGISGWGQGRHTHA